MASWLPHEGAIKAGLLLLAFAALALWETFRPRKELAGSASRRWMNHALLWTCSNVAAGWIFRASAVAVALAVRDSSFGVLNRSSIPLWLRFTAAVLLLDLARYGQHWVYHRVGWLWRLHRVHHSDRDHDWSTGLRFHPGEVLLTHGSYLAVVAALAPPATAVLLLELSDLALNLFVHANVALPAAMESALSRILVTPDMHRVHHSREISEQNTNFGVTLPFWDRLFRTYKPEPAAGQARMVTGLAGFAQDEDLSVAKMLAHPFHH